MTRYIDDDEIELCADRLRSELGFSNVERLDLMEVLKQLKHQGKLRDFAVVPNGVLGDADARFEDSGRILLSQKVATAIRQSDPRATWTIAHEIGHLTLGHTTRDRKSSGNQLGSFNKQLGRDEVDANRFAAAFLAPEALVNSTEATTAAEIQERFGLSKEASERRADELVRRYRRKNGIPRPLPQNALDFLAEAARRGHKLRPLVRKQVEVAIAPNAYIGDACPNPRCGEMKMVRQGLSTRCTVCGTETGDD